VNYHIAVAEDIPFIRQKIERNLTEFNERSASLLLILSVKHTQFGFHNHHHL
jgi:hypothetical protein